MLAGVDALVFDIQDIGARFYTYISTMGNAMQEAARLGIPFYVLDRPNPITGVHAEGPMLDADLTSFVGWHPMPLRHGMTAGEIARMFNGEIQIGANLIVVEMTNWERGDWFDSTALNWVSPSPNMKNLTAALLYPGVAMLEYSTNYSVGRGTDAPFEQIGAEFIKGRDLASYLNRRLIPGFRAYPAQFRPTASSLAGKTIEGVRMLVTDRDIFNSSLAGLEIAAALQNLYPGAIDFETNKTLIGNKNVISALQTGTDPRQIIESEREQLENFLKIREKYLVYGVPRPVTAIAARPVQRGAAKAEKAVRVRRKSHSPVHGQESAITGGGD
jgi:uncharacterized protein YbbC (DUF1343 family)